MSVALSSLSTECRRQRGFAFIGLLSRIDAPTDALAMAQLRSATVGDRALDVQGVLAQRRPAWA
jgi:hypothetical protein